MTRRYQDLGSASDWLKQIFSQSDALPLSRHQYGISALVSQASFRGEASTGYKNRYQRVKKSRDLNNCSDHTDHQR